MKYFLQFQFVFVLCSFLRFWRVVRAQDIKLNVAQQFQGVTGEVRAFGDSNSNKFTDVYVTDGNNVIVYVWENDQNQKKFSKSVETGEIELFSISNVIPSDFNRDGKMDVMVSGPLSEDANTLENQFYIQQNDGKLKFVNMASITSKDQLLLFDFDGDTCVDLFGEDQHDIRMVWRNVICDGSVELRFQEIPLQGFKKLREPHSNSFFDVNGDCLPDLVVTNEDELEIWINSGKANTFEGAEPTKTYALPTDGTMGQLTIADFNRNGSPDILFPTCSDQQCTESQLHVYLNEKSPKDQSDLCKPHDFFEYNDMSGSGDEHIIVDLGSLQGSGNLRFNPPQSRNKQDDSAPSVVGLLRLRVGDINRDGFPDLLVPVSQSGTEKILLWLNDAKDVAFEDFNFKSNSIDRSELHGASAATFFDMGENGVFDLIANKNNRIIVLENPGESDSYFLKTIGLNGACPAYCDKDDGPRFPDPKPYGVNQPGVSFKFVVTTLDNDREVREGVQLPQSAYDPLSVPYVLFGLGRTSNYVEFFYVGLFVSSTNPGDKHFFTWPAIIPNSQLIMFPYEATNPQNWTLELFISSPQSLMWVGISCLITLFAIAMVILFFHHREQKEDAAEKRKNEFFPF